MREAYSAVSTFGRFAHAYLLLLACSLVAISPLLQDGFPVGGDLMREVVRMTEYTHSLRDGGFPVRWGADLEGGYGYPIYNFFPPVFMFTASTFVIASGFSVLTAIKITLFLLTLAAGVGMYWFAREHFGNKGGLLAASLYVLSPYHFMDIFFRNAFSEFTALAIVPFVFYGLTRLQRETLPNPVTVLALSISGTLFVLSHNLSVLMYGPLLFFYALLAAASTRQYGKLCALIIPLSITFALTAFYTLPLIFERQFVQLWVMVAGDFNVQNNLLPPSDLISLWALISWWPLALISLGITIYSRSKITQPTFAILCFFSICLLILLFLITSVSKEIWNNIAVLQWLQFPWRLVSPAVFIICFLTGTIVYLSNENVKRMLMYAFGLLSVVIAVVFFTLLSIVNNGGSVLIPDEVIKPVQIRKQWFSVTVLSEYLPIWVKEQPTTPIKDRLTPSRPDIEVQKIRESAHRYAYKITTAEETLLTANLFYFPGWKIYVNDEEIQPKIPSQGLMQFDLPKGQSQVELKFENTPIRTLGNGLSLAGLLALGWMLLRATRVSRAQPCQ